MIITPWKPINNPASQTSLMKILIKNIFGMGSGNFYFNRVILNDSSHQAKLGIPYPKRPLAKSGEGQWGWSFSFLHSTASWTEAMRQVILCYYSVSIWQVSGQILFHQNLLSLASPCMAL